MPWDFRQFGKYGSAFGILAIAPFLGACSAPEAEPVSESDAALEVALASAIEHADDPLVSGKDVFESVCSACHSLTPPMKLAPPMLMIMGHYMDEYGNRESVAGAVQEWIVGPDSARSAMPAHAIERFGVMPPLPLSLEQRRAVTTYILDAYDEQGMGHDGPGMRGAGMPGGEGMRGMDGSGMRGRGMHRPDTMGQGG